MLSNRPALARPGAPGIQGDPPGAWQAVLVFLAVAGALYLVVGMIAPHLPRPARSGVSPPFTGHAFVRGWAQWDSGWYYRIAHDGYSYARGQQSSVAFFPAYPLAVRVVALLVGNDYVAGIVVTLISGAAAAALLFAWLRARLTPSGAWAALGAFLLFPYAFYLYGAVYADALFVASVLGAFLLLEADRPLLAGLAGAVATAARPLGLVVVIGLAVRAMERRGVLRPAGGGLVDLGRARWADAGVLLSVLGLGAWSLYLWSRFGDPFAFATVQGAWHQGAGPSTWLKFQFFHDAADFRSPRAWLLFMAHPVLTVAAACLVPRIFRRFGVGYGLYTVLLIGLAAMSTKNFFGMARYLLAAFPCFAVMGEMLAERARLWRWALPVSGVGLLTLTAIFGTGYYLS